MTDSISRTYTYAIKPWGLRPFLPRTHMFELRTKDWEKICHLNNHSTSVLFKWTYSYNEHLHSIVLHINKTKCYYKILFLLYYN